MTADKRLEAQGKPDTLLDACKAALRLFSKGHALDHFDWGKSNLRAEDIQELNELPRRLAMAIKRAEAQP